MSDYSKVYLFLGTFRGGIAGIDNDNDGTILKAEFRKAMYSGNSNNGNLGYVEWSGESSNSVDDLIDNFWAKFDKEIKGTVDGTDLRELNALNKTEESKLAEEVEQYAKMSQLIEILKGIIPEAPDGIKGTDYENAWRNSVYQGSANLLCEYIVNGGSEETFQKFSNAINETKKRSLGKVIVKEFQASKANEFADIQNYYTITYYSNLFINDVFGDILKEQAQGYNYAKDTVLGGILDNYLKEIEANYAEAKPEDIIESLKTILSKYFNTAGLTTKENSLLNSGEVLYLPTTIDSELETYGYDPKSWSSLQNSVITTLIYKRLDTEKNEEGKTLSSLFAGYENVLRPAIQKWISDRVEEGKTFAEIKALVNSSEFLDWVKNLVDDIKSGNENADDITQVENPGGSLAVAPDLISSITICERRDYDPNNEVYQDGHRGTFPDGRYWVNPGYDSNLHVAIPPEYNYSDLDITAVSKLGAKVKPLNGTPNLSHGGFMGYFHYECPYLEYPTTDTITFTVATKDGEYSTKEKVSIMIVPEENNDNDNSLSVNGSWTWDPGTASPWWNSDRDPNVLTLPNWSNNEVSGIKVKFFD